MSKLHLTDWRRRQLRGQFRESDDPRLRRRVEAVLAVAAGEPVASVAGRLSVTTRAVYHWVTVYSRERNAATLRSRPRSGRPRLLTDPERKLIGAALGRSPAELGYISEERWTVWLLRLHLGRCTGRRRPSDETVRRELRRQGWVWGRSGYVRAGQM